MNKSNLWTALAAVFMVATLNGCAPTVTERMPSMMTTGTPAPTTMNTPMPTQTIASTPTNTPAPTQIVAQRQPEHLSVARLLRLGKEPLGHTMYVWGGGWNQEDTAAGEEARSLGVSPVWADFAAKQDETYNYKDTRFQIHEGLDCSGYIGWLMYNFLETKDGEAGYVMKAAGMASSFAERGFGEFTSSAHVTDWQAGDIMSMDGHVWMALGMCEDGSVVLLHASPPGVILSGTKLPDGSESMAVELASYYMKTCYPEWYARYPDTSRPHSYLTNSHRMRWHKEVLSDEEGLRGQSADAVLAWMFADE